MGNEIKLLQQLGPTATNFGYLGIDCPNSSFDIEPIIENSLHCRYKINMETPAMSMMGGNLKDLDLTKPVDVLILVRNHKEF